MTPQRPPLSFLYVDSDIPPGMTIREWRAHRAAARAAQQQVAREAGRRLRRRRLAVARLAVRAALPLRLRHKRQQRTVGRGVIA